MIATILVHWWYQQNSENAKNVVVCGGGLWLVACGSIVLHYACGGGL
jgi:hypothetical protein